MIKRYIFDFIKLKREKLIGIFFKDLFKYIIVKKNKKISIKMHL